MTDDELLRWIREKEKQEDIIKRYNKVLTHNESNRSTEKVCINIYNTNMLISRDDAIEAIKQSVIMAESVLEEINPRIDAMKLLTK